MQTLNEKEWKEVNLEDEFGFERGKEKNMAELSSGDIPLISARKVNNGLKDFVKNPAKIITGNHVISLNNDGDGGAGLAYFQSIDFALDTHVTALHPKKVVPKMALLFLSTAISKQHAVFGHGRSISLSRAKRLKAMLPVTGSGEPDYDYMAQYVVEHQTMMLQRYRHYVAELVSQLEYQTIPALQEKTWQNFFFKDIFSSIQRGKRLIKEHQISGKKPYISSTALNNGVDNFIDNNEGIRIFDYCLTIANSGSVGASFFHPYAFVASDHVTHLKNEQFNEYIYLFIASVSRRLSEKYNFNREINEQRIAKEQIMLPVTSSGKPDYDYMEQYAKNIMRRKYAQYLAFIEAKQSFATHL